MEGQFDRYASYRCYNCNEELSFEVKIGRRDQCPNCYAYLHCCYNCKFWDPNVHNECLENRAEFIRDRAEGNFCLYFTFKPVEEDTTSEADTAKSKLEALFGKGKGTVKSAEAQDPKSKLEALFKK